MVKSSAISDAASEMESLPQQGQTTALSPELWNPREGVLGKEDDHPLLFCKSAFFYPLFFIHPCFCFFVCMLLSLTINLFFIFLSLSTSSFSLSLSLLSLSYYNNRSDSGGGGKCCSCMPPSLHLPLFLSHQPNYQLVTIHVYKCTLLLLLFPICPLSHCLSSLGFLCLAS